MLHISHFAEDHCRFKFKYVQRSHFHLPINEESIGVISLLVSSDILVFTIVATGDVEEEWLDGEYSTRIAL